MYLKFTDNEVLLLNDDLIKIENDEIFLNDKGRWITIHPNGEDNKGKHLFIKDGETPKQAVERVYGKGKGEATKKNVSEWSQQFNRLDHSQREALHDYFSAENKNINSYLRRGADQEWSESYTKRIEKRIDRIDSSMRTLPTDTNLIRMVSKDDVMKLLNINTLDKSIIGKSIKQKGYTSTTYDESSSIFGIYHDNNKYVRLNLNVDEGVKGVSMEEALVGDDYDEDDYESIDIRNEKEILLQRGLTMKIANITKVDGQIIIKCDVSV